MPDVRSIALGGGSHVQWDPKTVSPPLIYTVQLPCPSLCSQSVTNQFLITYEYTLDVASSCCYVLVKSKTLLLHELIATVHVHRGGLEQCVNY